MARFGALAEILIDQIRKFLGSFEELCTKALTNHCTTSTNHLEADGLAEKIVQIVKRGLRKYRLLARNHCDWDFEITFDSDEL